MPCATRSRASMAVNGFTLAYVSNTLGAGALQLYLGLRAENTRSAYTGHVVTRDTTGAVLGVTTVPGSQTYTDLFPSAQFRIAFAPETQVRLAVTRGIARPELFRPRSSSLGHIRRQQVEPGESFVGQSGP